MIRRRYGHPGLKPTAYPKSVRYKVDYDYLDKLSEDELTFLERVTNEVVGGTGGFYHEKNAANRDMLTHHESDAYLRAYYGDTSPQGGSLSTHTTDAYLSSDEYKSALRAYRTHVHDQWTRKPEMTVAMMRARQRLEKLSGKRKK